MNEFDKAMLALLDKGYKGISKHESERKRKKIESKEK